MHGSPKKKSFPFN